MCLQHDRFLKRKRSILQQTRTLEYKYLSGRRELDREETKIFRIEQEIKATDARRAEVEEAIKNGACKSLCIYKVGKYFRQNVRFWHLQ